jgi:two-component system sensor histidine kinase/response regulator
MASRFTLRDLRRHVALTFAAVAATIRSLGCLERELAAARRTASELKTLEGRFRDILESMEEWAWEVDAAGRYTYASPKVAEILGYSPDEIIGRTPFDFMSEGEAERVKNVFLDHVARKALFRRLDNANLRKDGTIVHLETTGFPVLSSHGQLLGFRGVDRDVTESRRAEAALRERDELYRTAFHTSPDAININRLSDGLFVDINDGFTRQTGFTREDVAGRTSLDINVWVDTAERERLVAELRRSGSVTNMEFRFRRKDGSLTTALMSARLIAIKGEPHILSITRDISERKRAEVLLQESEVRSRLLLEGMSIGFGIDDLNGRSLKPNEGLSRLLGYSAAELQAMSFVDYTDPAYVEQDRSLYRELAAGRRESYQIEKSYRTKDGRRVWGRITRALVREAGGRPEYCITALEDITQRKELEQSLVQREAQLSGILEASPAAIVLKDVERRYLMVNAAYGDFQGRRPEDLIGRRAEDFQDPEQAENTLREDRRVLESGRPFAFAETRVGRGGRERHYSVVKFPVWDRERAMIGIGMIAVDVTRQKRAEKALRAAKEKAEAANRTKTLFLANMSHELRTPLNSILGFSEMLALELFGPLETRYKEYSGLIRKSGTHLLGIINDLLDMSCIESEKVRLDMVPLDIAALVEESIVVLRELAEANRVTIRKDLAARCDVIGDEQRMRQVFINILSNAIKFSPGGTVTIAADGGPGGNRIVVADTGIGMSDEDIELALQPFGQAEQNPEVRRFQGTGLGLPIAKRLVELLGGTLDIASLKGKGTAVTITLPGAARQRRGRPRTAK